MYGRLISIGCILIWGIAFADDATIQAALDQARIDNRVTAMQMTIIYPDKKSATFNSGMTTNDAQAKKITSDTLFQIGSETKSFTAALMVKLDEQRVLSLSDKVAKYFPEYKKWRNITIWQLLHNNSGIPSYSENKSFQKALAENPKRVWTPKELLAIANKMSMTFQPGNGWHYSNSNFILAGMIAEKVTKKSLSQLYHYYFLNPSALDLSHTHYLPTIYSPLILKLIAHGYDENGRDVISDNMSWAGAAGAMVSNSIDLADWAYALFHNEVLPAEDTRKMMTLVSTKSGAPITTNDASGYGMGIGMRKSNDYGRWYGHEGETLGFHVIFLWFPELDLTASVLANGEALKLRDFAETIPSITLSYSPVLRAEKFQAS